MRVLALLIGVILLLPGACSLGFIVMSLGESGSQGPLPLLWLICFAVSFGGVMLIRNALRRRDPPT